MHCLFFQHLPFVLIPKINVIMQFFLSPLLFVTYSWAHLPLFEIFVSSCPQLLLKYKPTNCTLRRSACFFLLSKHQTWKTFLLVILIYFLCSGLQHQCCNHGGTEALCSKAHTLAWKHTVKYTPACTYWGLSVKAVTLFINTVWWEMQLNIPFWLLRWGAVIRGSLNIPPCLTLSNRHHDAELWTHLKASLMSYIKPGSCLPHALVM